MELAGDRVRLRPAVEADADALVSIRSRVEVSAHWRGADLETEVRRDIAAPDHHLLVIEDRAGMKIGGIQWHTEDDPDYRSAGIDVYLDPTVHGRGLGTDAVRTLARYLLEVVGHHRLTIDPAADNGAAIRCYEKVGFHAVGVMRQYERGADGSWHDGLLMDLLADDRSD